MKKLETFNYSVNTRSGRNYRQFVRFIDAHNYCIEMSKSYDELFYMSSLGSLTITVFYHGKPIDSTTETYSLQ